MKQSLTFLLNIVWFFGVFGQDNFFHTYDYMEASQSNASIKCSGMDCFTVGVSVCQTGECTVLTKYLDGEFIFSKVIDDMDVNSYNSFDIINDDTLIITGLAKYDSGIRTIKLDFDGNIMENLVITKDSLLSFEWPVDALYLDSFYLGTVIEGYPGQERYGSIYKIDYSGNLIDDVRMPFYPRTEVYTLALLPNGNLFVTQPYEEEECWFEHGDQNRENAVLFHELDLASLEIIRSKSQICQKSTSPVSSDAVVLENGDIIRTVFLRDTFDYDISSAANITYDSAWDIKSIYSYPILETPNFLYVYGIINTTVFVSSDPDYYYIVGNDLYPYDGPDYPYVNTLIEKWHIENGLIWTRIISDPNVYYRVFLSELEETENSLVLTGSVWYEGDDYRTQDFATMSLDRDGCYNGNCSDTIYLNGPPVQVNVEEATDYKTQVYPNPCSDVINLVSNNDIISIEVLTPDMQVVLSMKETNSKRTTLDVSNLASSIYFLKIMDSRSSFTLKKIVKL